MFKELLQLFGPQNAFRPIKAKFMEAFRAAVEVFATSHEALWSGDTSEETARRIYDSDVTVNQSEREVRKMVVRHLSVQQGLDILYSLRFMSLIKDVERIGDYGKNLFEVGELRRGDFDAGELEDRLRRLGEESCRFLREAIEVFDASDDDRAEAAIERGRRLMERSEDTLRDVATDGVSPNTSACFVLMARHYKRAVGHATNVLTGLVMPIHALDYFDESYR